jgi:exopolyphosphatase/guanosine-5'-triphosphate,3'-diphosphate pyrophosphatase
VLTQKIDNKHINTLPEYIAAVDMGSNSFHMVVAKISHGEIRVIDKLGEKVQLAAGLNRSGEITQEAHERALSCLSRFAQRLQGLDTSAVQIVGTNALRAAKKKINFLREAEVVTGFPIEIISGREEARLIYLGVAHTLADDLGNRLVIDIGGGSTELIVGERFETKALESLHIGCVSFRERYFPDGALSKKAFDKAVKHASRELLSIKRHYKSIGWENSVGSSGTVKAILHSLNHLGLAEEHITFDALKKLKSKLLKYSNIKDITELGVKKERASIFPAGFAILYACFDVLNIQRMQFTTGALREGLLYDILGRIRHEDVRERTLQSMQSRYGIDTIHAEHVEETAMHAYYQVAKAWGIESIQNENLLRWASRIYEVGLSIAHAQYHRHGGYLVYHSDLPGFTRLAQLHLSVIVRTHRRKFSSEPFNGLSESESALLKKLCVIFRLAIVLTAARKNAENSFVLSVDANKLMLDMGEDWLEENPLILSNLGLEKELLRYQDFELNM